MRWTVLSGGAAWLAAAGLLAACAGSMGGSTENKVAMAPTSFNEIAGWAEDKHGEALAAFRRSCPKLDRRARHQDRDRRRQQDHHRRGMEADLRRRRRGEGRRRSRRAGLLRGEFPAAGGPGAGQVHRLLRARAARQPRALAPVHGAGLSPAARPHRQALLHARRDRAGRAARARGWRSPGCRIPSRCSRSRSRAAAASISPKAARSASASTAPTTGPIRRSATCWSRWA